MNNFKLPTCSQIWGDHSACYGYGPRQLPIIKKLGGGGAKLTDFAILSGAMYDKGHQPFGYYWVDEILFDWPICACDSKGNHHSSIDYGNCHVGARPIIDYSWIADYSSRIRINSDGIVEVLYGNYPQNHRCFGTEEMMEWHFQRNNLTESGRRYTINKNGKGENLIEFVNPQTFGFYVRCVGDEVCAGKILSDGTKVEIGKPYWIEVNPVVWLIDPEKEIALSKNILFSGLSFYEAREFMNDVFAKEITALPNLKQNKIVDSSDPVTVDQNFQFTLMESLIISLKLKNENYSVETISKILSISEEYVSSVLNKIFSVFSSNIDSILYCMLKATNNRSKDQVTINMVEKQNHDSINSIDECFKKFVKTRNDNLMK